MAYHVAGTSKQEPEGEAAHNADRVNAALHRGGVIVDRYLHVARFTIPSAVTEWHLGIHHTTVPLLHRGSKVQLEKKIKEKS